jgi:hypothetical protein
MGRNGVATGRLKHRTPGSDYRGERPRTRSPHVTTKDTGMKSPIWPAPDGREERRAHPRIPAAAVPYLQARVAGGPQVRLLDLSKRGVHLETTMHMRPGRTVIIRFLSGDAAMAMTSAVVRSSVAVLEATGEVTYHTALAFTDELTLCSAEFDEAATGDTTFLRPPAPPTEEAYMMIVMDGRIGTASVDGSEAR